MIRNSWLRVLSLRSLSLVKILSLAALEFSENFWKDKAGTTVHPFFTCSRSASFRMAAIFSLRAGPFKASGGGPVLSPPEAVFSTAVSPVDIVGGPERTTSPSNPWLQLKIFNFFQFSKKNKLKNNTVLLCCCCRSFYFTHIEVLRHRPRHRNRSMETLNADWTYAIQTYTMGHLPI